MNVEDAILRRRSVRSYKSKEISRGEVERVMNAVRMAPSASNKQDWKFIIVDDEKKKNGLCETAIDQSFAKEAPAIIAGINTDPEYKMGCGIPSGIVDLSIAMDHLTLKAAEEGLGTCWIGAFDQGKAKRVLDIPKEYEIVALITIGYPKRPLEREGKDRKDLEEVISYNSFSK